MAVMTLAMIATAFGLAGMDPAQADSATTISFVEPTKSVSYGSDWHTVIRVTAAYDTLDTPDGTVDVFADGSATPLVAGITIYRGGVAYLSEDASAPPLAAGDHQLTALFHPSAGSALITSQTPTPLTLTVTPLGLTARATVEAAAAVPTVDLSLSGAWVKALSVPAGKWTVRVVDSENRQLLSKTVSQSAGSTTPVAVDLRDGPRPGQTVTVTATFVSPAVAAGGTLTQPVPLKITLPSLTPAQVLSAPMPWWSAGIAVLAVLISAGPLVVQLRRARRRRAAP